MGQKIYDLADYRIDYVRIRLALDIGEKMAEQKYWCEQAERVAAAYRLPNDYYATGSYYDVHVRKTFYYFECWGKASAGIFDLLTLADLKNVMRLDIRKEIEDGQIDFDELFRYGKARNKPNSTVKVYSSPFRTKKTGRNAGGETLQIGGDQSQQRLNIYKRSKEAPAVELQCEGEFLRNIIQDALFGEVNDNYKPLDLVKEGLVLELEDKVLQRVGFTIDQIEEGQNWQQLRFCMLPVEDRLTQLQFNFEGLPTEAQEAFLEAVVPNFEATIVSVAPEAEEKQGRLQARGPEDFEPDDWKQVMDMFRERG